MPAAKKRNLSLLHVVLTWLLLLALPASSLASYGLAPSRTAPATSGAVSTQAETRVWEIFANPGKSAWEKAAQTRINTWENREIGLKTALGGPEGRFWSMDTFQGSRRDPGSLHKYLYCHAEPINARDRNGHETAAEVSVASGIAATTAAVGAVSVEFGVSASAGGAALANVGAVVEASVLEVTESIGAETISEAPEVISEIGGRRVLDLLLKVGDRLVYIESKYQFPFKAGAQLTRFIAQMEGATATAAEGDTVVAFAYKQAQEATMQRILNLLSNEALARVTFVQGYGQLAEFLEGLAGL